MEIRVKMLIAVCASMGKTKEHRLRVQDPSGHPASLTFWLTEVEHLATQPIRCVTRTILGQMQVWLWVSHIRPRSISCSLINKPLRVHQLSICTTYRVVGHRQARAAVWWWSWWTMLLWETLNNCRLIINPQSLVCLGCLMEGQPLIIPVWAGAETTRSDSH